MAALRWLGPRDLPASARSESIVASTEYFQQAIEKDPGYAQAWAGLADSFVLLGVYSSLPPAEIFPRAAAAARRAIAMEESLAEAHVSLAHVNTNYAWDWQGAEREFRRAIELNPEYGTAHIVSLLAYPRLVTSFRAPFANPRRDRPSLGNYSLPIIHRVRRNGYCHVFR